MKKERHPKYCICWLEQAENYARVLTKCGELRVGTGTDREGP